MVEIVVPGQPVPQPRPRVSTRGGFGRAYTPSAHPIHAYRQAITLMARTAKRITGAAVLEVEAIFARPASHWRKHDLKPSAPQWVKGIDGDNVLKGVQDALTDAGLWDDDDQVIDSRIRKRYASRNEQARTIIRVGPAP